MKFIHSLFTCLLFLLSPALFAADFSLPANTWKMISLPSAPPEDKHTIKQIFGDDIAGQYQEEWALFEYDTQNKRYREMSDSDRLEQGKGYWIIQIASDTVTLDMPEGSTDGTPVSVPLTSSDGQEGQWNMVGSPFPSPRSLSDLKIKGTDICIQGCDLNEAKQQGLAHNQAWFYNGTDYDALNTTDTVNPWEGLWVYALPGSSGHNLSWVSGSKTYYVDTTHGSDNNDGSSAHPLQHIQKAIDLAEAGERIFVRRGLYFESLQINKSGSTSKPIVIEGETDANGNLLAHIHGGEKITGQWVSAEGDPLNGVRLDNGVYKLTGIQGNTYAMTIYEDGVFKDIPRVDVNTVGDNAVHYFEKRAEVFNIKPSDTVPLYSGNVRARYWDGIEAIYTQVGDTLYIRFGDYQNPNNLALYRAGGGAQNIETNRTAKLNEHIEQSATFKIDNASYITLKNLKIDGAQSGVMIRGENAHHNRVEYCDIVNGQHRIMLTQETHDNLVAHNRLHMVLLSKYRPMAWWDIWRKDKTGIDEENYKYVVAQHYYEAYKHEIGLNTSGPQDDTGVYLYSAGGGNEIAHNEIYDTLAGVFGDEIGGVKIHHNYFHHISGTSVGRGRGLEGDGAYVYQNNFMNVHIAVRFNADEVEHAKERLWFYDNLIYNPLGLGVAIYPTLYEGAESAHAELCFYHNTAVNVGNDNLDQLFGGDNILFVNNLYYKSKINFTPDREIGHFAYNWFEELNTIQGTPKRFENNNIEADGTIPFTLPDTFTNNRASFALNADSTAKGAGIDLSEPFEIDGNNYEPLPGIKGGYSHDMGVITH